MSKQIALVSMSCLFLMLAGMMPAASTGMMSASAVYAQEEPATATATPATPAEPPADAPADTPAADLGVGYAFDNGMLLMFAFLVLFMQCGFAMVEAGFNSSKNTVNILAKNLMDFCVGGLLFYAIGFGIMYNGSYSEPVVKPTDYFGFGGFGIYEQGATRTFAAQADFLFQCAFAATAATIVSGAVAGRMTFKAYLIYTIFISAVVYPISGYWKWGYGFLHDMGFYDFAGSGVVHMVGGFAGLAGAICLGPRLGRFSSTGKSQAMPAHNMSLAALGVFILWFGWYGFNPGSVLAFQGTAKIDLVSMVAVNTTLAACAGGLGGMLLAWVIFGKPDFAMALNGVLAGLVGITANADGVDNMEAIIIGAVAGLLVVIATIALDKMKIDDPVGAFPVHGVCGMWALIAIPIFCDYGSAEVTLADGTTKDVIFGTWPAQLTGLAVLAVWAFVTMFILFMILKVVGILRVTPEEEEQGLDISEHGMHAYIH
jgi:Amt family ammonium transporter